MSKGTVLATFLVGGAVAAALSACDVQVHDTTPAQFPANHDAGLYEIKATVTPDTLVTPSSVMLFGISGKERFNLEADRSRTEWHAMLPVRCHSSFPLQILAVWKVQGITTEHKVVPEQAPREIKLVEPEPTKEASIDTSGKAPKGGWVGSVKYRFVTQADTQITGARIEPASQDPADVAASKGTSVTTPLPVDAMCAAPTELQLTSTAQKGAVNLVIDTNNPAYPHWTTKVDLAPKS